MATVSWLADAQANIRVMISSLDLDLVSGAAGLYADFHALMERIVLRLSRETIRGLGILLED
eukprot:1394946-Amorphochlora_amoeboformis.AAC.1